MPRLRLAAAAAAMLVGLLTAAVQAAPCPDMTMAITTKPTAKAGGLHRFRVRIGNTGSADLSPVAVLLTLPGGFSAAHSSGKGMVAQGRNVTWTGLSLRPRKSKTLTITAKADLCPPLPSLPTFATGSASLGSSCATPAMPSGPVTTKQTAKSAKAVCAPAPTAAPTQAIPYTECYAGKDLGGTSFVNAGTFPTAQACVNACGNNYPTSQYVAYQASTGNCQCSIGFACNDNLGWTAYSLILGACLACAAPPAPPAFPG